MVSERKRYTGGGGSGKSSKRDSSQNAADIAKMFNKVVKHLRFTIPCKKGILAGMKVDYFVGSTAVDTLLQSQWAEIKEHKNAKALFRTREDCVDYMQALIDRNMVHRSYKIYKPHQQTPEKRKFKLEVHDDQTFLDSDEELYVWVYEPATLKQYLFGAALVTLVIVCCLFPLWPARLRSLAVYGSMGSAGLLGVLLALALIKYVIFIVVWLGTRGRIHFWFLPNLSEDVGFFESFVPVYEVKYPKEKKTKKKTQEEEERLIAAAEAATEQEQCVEDIRLEDNNEETVQPNKKEDEDFELLSASELEQNGK